MGCTIAKPIVDGIEREYRNRLYVIRVDIQSSAGASLARQYHSQVTPSFIFFDASGRELWRSIGQIDPMRIREHIPGVP